MVGVEVVEVVEVAVPSSWLSSSMSVRWISRSADVPSLKRFPPMARGLPSSTSQLNLSAFYGIGGARIGIV